MSHFFNQKLKHHLQPKLAQEMVNAVIMEGALTEFASVHLCSLGHNVKVGQIQILFTKQVLDNFVK